MSSTSSSHATGQVNFSPFNEVGGPSIFYIPNFLPESTHKSLYEELVHSTLWDDRMKARKLASMGVSYDYNEMRLHAAPIPESICKLSESVTSVIAENGLGNIYSNSCLLNYYVDNKSYIGFHSDNTQMLVLGTGVAIVSLGAVRTMVFREKKNRQNEFSLPLQPGSLLYMTDEMQIEWLHGIPKQPNIDNNSGDVNGRISITLRQIQINSDTTPSQTI